MEDRDGPQVKCEGCMEAEKCRSTRTSDAREDDCSDSTTPGLMQTDGAECITMRVGCVCSLLYVRERMPKDQIVSICILRNACGCIFTDTHTHTHTHT